MSESAGVIDFIVPCFNPLPQWEVNLADTFDRLQGLLEGVTPGLILVNDGSDPKRVKEKHIEYLRQRIPQLQYISCPENRGKGQALRVGVEASTSRWQIFTDIDFPYLLESMMDVYRELERGSDVVLGFREPSYYQKVPLFRKLLSKAFRWSLKSLLRLKITDTQCGLKGFNQHGRKLFLNTTINRFLFDMEFVLLVSKSKKLSIRPVTVHLRDDVTFSTMNLKVLLPEMFNFVLLLFKRRKDAG